MRRPHDLVRVHDPDTLLPPDAPEWSRGAIGRAPWVVVRRELTRPGRVAVGIRGDTRAQRYGLLADESLFGGLLQPEDLVGVQARRETPAFAALAAARSAMDASGFTWGPVGSVGFELATGAPVVGYGSDLDLVIRASLADADALSWLAMRFALLPVRVDCLVETSAGGVALAELLANTGEVMLRTAAGPRLVTAP